MLQSSHRPPLGKTCQGFACLTALVCFVTVPSLRAQKTQSTFSYIDDQAVLAQHGSETAARNVTAKIFSLAGVAPELATAFGFQERIVQNEMLYRQGAHGPIHEVDIVKAVNNLASSMNAPLWAHTDLIEVRTLRMSMLTMYPRMIANSHPTPGKRLEILSKDMSPLEATHIAVMLIEQKTFNKEYQFTHAEKAVLANADPKIVDSAYQQRCRDMRNTITGETSGRSLRDLLRGADNFFTDLGLQPVGQQAAAVTK